MRGMLAEMSASELSEWEAFFSLEPWGFEEENRRMSVLAYIVAKFSGRAPPSLRPEDFMPRRREPVDLIAKAKAIFGWKGKG